jgi:hypothetical protein
MVISTELGRESRSIISATAIRRKSEPLVVKIKKNKKKLKS